MSRVTGGGDGPSKCETDKLKREICNLYIIVCYIVKIQNIFIVWLLYYNTGIYSYTYVTDAVHTIHSDFVELKEEWYTCLTWALAGSHHFSQSTHYLLQQTMTHYQHTAL